MIKTFIKSLNFSDISVILAYFTIFDSVLFERNCKNGPLFDIFKTLTFHDPLTEIRKNDHNVDQVIEIFSFNLLHFPSCFLRAKPLNHIEKETLHAKHSFSSDIAASCQLKFQILKIEDSWNNEHIRGGKLWLWKIRYKRSFPPFLHSSKNSHKMEKIAGLQWKESEFS